MKYAKTLRFINVTSRQDRGGQMDFKKDGLQGRGLHSSVSVTGYSNINMYSVRNRRPK